LQNGSVRWEKCETANPFSSTSKENGTVEMVFVEIISIGVGRGQL
jgi:hypothetical protein